VANQNYQLRDEMFRMADVFVVSCNEHYATYAAIMHGERFGVRELMAYAAQITVVWCYGRTPTLVLKNLNALHKVVKILTKMRTHCVGTCNPLELQSGGYRLSPTRDQWKMLVDEKHMGDVDYDVRPAHRMDDVLQVELDIEAGHPLLAVCKKHGIPVIVKTAIAMDTHSPLMFTVRNKRNTDTTNYHSFIANCAAEEGYEVWQRNGSCRVKADTPERLRLAVEVAEGRYGLLAFTDAPKRWKDLDHTSGYKALPSAEPTPASTVVLKAAASTGAKLMRAALESIGYELVKWSPLMAQIKKKDEAANLHPASIPYEFTGQFKGLILDYEDNF
jgi:hypothetical protein